MITAFFAQPCRPYRDFQLIMTLITLNFAIPSITYVVAPQIASGSLHTIGAILGGPEFPVAIEDASLLWRMLGASNVMTLALMCGLLQYNLRYYFPVLLPLSFLKLTSAALFAATVVVTGQRAFGSVAVLDSLTGAAFIALSIRAHRAIAHVPDDQLVPRPR